MTVRTVVLAGLAGALAMVPPGAVLRAAGHEVNRYGELLAAQLTGSVHPAVLLACWPPLKVQTTAPFRMPMSGT